MEGSGETGEHLKWGLKEQKSVKEKCECARLICSVIENGGKGVYFSATDKNPP